MKNKRSHVRRTPGKCPRCQTEFSLSSKLPTSVHFTMFMESNHKEGIGALCQSCWDILTPKERLPWYIKTFHKWMKSSYCLDGQLPDEKYCKDIHEITYLQYAEWDWGDFAELVRSTHAKWKLIKRAVRAGK